ncbi:protein dopey homolog PFC0245c-like isoform X2 [Odontomachus brunneus]|uniref:protein dopey homolog PFC0245c-like isoform X2 n=1 Tax=Odontomachus brunneus TaxID=486640 RepID=UPI0013F23309|nr:protein dopey homolog PFC0245c-like isoform X2 [Odontomachus brunneus]
MGHHKLKQNKRKQQATQNISKLKEFRVILYDIALYPALIPSQYKQLFKQQLKRLKDTSCTPKNHNIQLLKQNVRNNRYSRSVKKGREKHERIKSRLFSKDIESIKETQNNNECDKILQSTPGKQLTIGNRWQLIIDDDSSTIDDCSPKKISCIPKNTVLTNIKVPKYALRSTASRRSTLNTSTSILSSDKSDLTDGTSVESADADSDSTNYLDKKNLNFINCNSETQEVSSDEISIASTKYDRNLTPVDFVNETNHRVKQKYNQSKKSLTIPSIESEISTKSFKDTEEDEVSENSYSSDILLNHTSNNKVNRKENQHDTRTKLNNYNVTPAVDLKFTAIVSETAAINHITKDNFPKTYNENKSQTIKQTLPKITQNAFLPKGTVKLIRFDETYSNAWRNISKNNTLIQNKCTEEDKNVKQVQDKNILKKEDNIFFTEIEVNSTSKTSENILIQKNSIQQDILDNNDIHNKILNHETPSSLAKNDIHNNININNSSIEVEDRKRTAEENSTDVNTCAKRIKLNRNFQQSDIESYNKPVNQQFNSFINTITATENAEYDEIDLRVMLNKKRTENVCKLKTTDSDETINTMSMKVNNTNSVKNIVENEGTSEKFSQKEASTLNKDLYKKQNNAQISLPHSNNSYSFADLYDASEETHCNKKEINYEKTNAQKKHTDVVSSNNNNDNEEDDDCISLFANETFDISYCEDIFPDKEEKLPKPLQSDTPYIMSTNSFNMYLKQNKNEFNQEYERCLKNNIKKSQIAQNSTKNRTEKMKVIESLPEKCNKNELLTAKQTIPKINQNGLLLKETVRYKLLEQTQNRTLHTDNRSANLTSSMVQNIQTLKNCDIKHFFNGFCFSTLMHSTCKWQHVCTYKHNFQKLINTFYAEDPSKIMDVIKFTIDRRFYFFCQEFYQKCLKKLKISEILTVYKSINSSIITDVTKNNEILECIKHFIKPGEYWYIARSMILMLTPDKYIVESILRDCKRHKKLSDVQDINSMLINKLHPGIISQLDKNLMMHFKSLLNGEAAKDIYNVESVQDFGESLVEVDTIASPDSKQIDSPESYNNAVTDGSQSITKRREINAISTRSYILHSIDNLPEAQSVYRNHKHLWKFYTDLERLKKGLEHEDYNYVIDILEEYAGKQDSNLFVRACCNMLRTEIKRTDHHLINIIERTVQTGSFAVLRRMLFDIGIDILVALMDEEAWRLAFHFVTLLKTCDLPSSAEFTMLSAEIYLANKKTLEAFDLIKNSNIICTNRAKWRVRSTIHDEYVRNKLIYILLDSLCNNLIEYAFFLFTFLLRDQSSQFYPIDLSCYVDKLTVLLLSRNKMASIIEMGNLILKYNFQLNTKAYRALIATLIHGNEKLAIQLYNYAEGIGLYSTIELWPVTHIIIKNDLTEEEVYLAILQLLEKLKINFGHTIEFIKSNIVVYIILEVKSEKQFYCAAEQSFYNRQAIANMKSLVRNVLKTRFDPPISLIARVKEKICKLQKKSLINYLRSEHCN